LQWFLAFAPGITFTVQGKQSFVVARIMMPMTIELSPVRRCPVQRCKKLFDRFTIEKEVILRRKGRQRGRHGEVQGAQGRRLFG
jgi:hypothetical protein